jgi:hypothetical protein
MVLETAVLTFALTMIAPMPQPTKAAAKKNPIPKIATVQKDPRFADFAKGVLKCYHPTARYQSATLLQRGWARQAEYGAKSSALVSNEYTGISNANYTLVVGVLAKPDAVKTVIRSDTAKIRAYEACELGDWVAAK